MSQQKPSKLELTAKALWCLKQAGLIQEKLCKGPVSQFIRQATEASSHHCSVHFVSQGLIEKHGEDLKQQFGKKRVRSAYHNHCEANFKHEHVVPVDVIYQLICSDSVNSELAMLRALEKYCLRATILEDEAKTVDSLYKQTMPEGFYKDSPEGQHRLYDDPLARYRALEIVLVPRSEVPWLKMML